MQTTASTAEELLRLEDMLREIQSVLNGSLTTRFGRIESLLAEARNECDGLQRLKRSCPVNHRRQPIERRR